jgi:hypothetical protein
LLKAFQDIGPLTAGTHAFYCILQIIDTPVPYQDVDLPCLATALNPLQHLHPGSWRILIDQVDYRPERLWIDRGIDVVYDRYDLNGTRAAAGGINRRGNQPGRHQH